MIRAVVTLVKVPDDGGGVVNLIPLIKDAIESKHPGTDVYYQTVFTEGNDIAKIRDFTDELFGD